MKENIILEDMELILDEAGGGKVWINGRDDKLCYIKLSEIKDVIKYLSQFIRD